jgi:hypothetical protein
MQGNVKFSFCRIKYSAMKTYERVKVHLNRLITPALDELWSALSSGRFATVERDPCTRWI